MHTMFLAAAAVSLIACTVEAPETSTTTQNAETHNRLAANRLAANRLAANRLAANRLAANSLSSTKLSANADSAEILGTFSGRVLYSYIVSCALADGISISKTNVIEQACEPADADYNYTTCVVGQPANDTYCTNGTCTFVGGVGVAPEWADRKLNPHGQGWVSACLLARVNAHDTAEAISLRGRNPALSVSTTELATYTVQEGAFYGNVFDNPGSTVIDWNACSGTDNADAVAQLRDCAAENPATPGVTFCGFNYAGNCAAAFAGGERACELYNPDTTSYGDCHADASAKKYKTNKYREVVTTYTSP